LTLDELRDELRDADLSKDALRLAAALAPGEALTRE
jgi:hypothetical protein